MNRIIKFRAYHPDYGMCYDCEPCFDKREFYPFGIAVGFSHYSEELEEWDIMQYTGLEDSKGKEIYEGDIIGWDYYCQTEHIVEYSIVIWDEKNACFDFQDYNRPDFCYRKVIGNIHENKELLQSKE